MLNKNGYTQNTADNAKLVSPSFMIASQLGNMNAGGDLETANYHCKNYVEVTNVTFKGETPNYTDQKICSLLLQPHPLEHPSRARRFCHTLLCSVLT